MRNIFKARRSAGSLLVAAAFIGGCRETGSSNWSSTSSPTRRGTRRHQHLACDKSTGGGALVRIVGTNFRTLHPDGTTDIEVEEC